MSRMLILAAAMLSGGLFIAAHHTQSSATAPILRTPAPHVLEPISGRREVAILAGGCFWGVQGVFSHVKGIVSATSGYAGGEASTANYEAVSTGTTGHAESVRIVFDPSQVNYATLLRIYFSVATDPTQLNRQGPDEGPQYRTAIFPQSPAQQRVAGAYLAQLSAAHLYPRPIVTRLERTGRFFPAEDYHQQYMARHPTNPYIVVNDLPKVDALRRLFPANWHD